ncbi:hypothetical protein ANN_05302 [Periplaneta americana]|uniref:Uncharacterized protein n=1 Tax=Periplaneta americana TaxID=6978 RepID=A0ABQ8TCI7_PERAM|nr:hypothetical protein ANN_05302 [Periplaneta americana]
MAGLFMYYIGNMFASLKSSFSRLFGNSDPEKKKQESTNKPKEGKECTDQGPNRIPSMSEGTEDCSRNPVSEPVIEKSRNFITNESRLSSFETEDLFDPRCGRSYYSTEASGILQPGAPLVLSDRRIYAPSALSSFLGKLTPLLTPFHPFLSHYVKQQATNLAE